MKTIIYDQTSSVSFGKKALAYLIDFVILIMIGSLCSFLTVEVSKKTEGYLKSAEVVETQIDLMNAMTSEAKLLKIHDDGEIYTMEEMYKDFAISHILRSYDENTDKFHQAGIENPHEVEGIKGIYTSATDENDSLAYVYCHYFPKLGEDSNRPIYEDDKALEFFKTNLQRTGQDLSMFDMSSEYPVLKAENAINLYSYIVLSKKDDAYKNENTKLAAVYTACYNLNVDYFKKLTSYQELYKVYLSNYRNLILIINLDHIIAYLISALLVFALPVLIFRKGMSVGKRALKIALAPKEGEGLRWTQILLRATGDVILSFPAIFVTALFTTGTNSIVMPLAVIGSFSFNLIFVLFLVGILSLANVAVLYFRKDNRSLLDLIAQTKILRISYQESVPVELE